jgi:hypothetical protein
MVSLAVPFSLTSERNSMGRIRTIKPEFFTHFDLFDAEQESALPLRVAYAGLWTCCDREGRFKWRPRELKLAVLPYDDCDFSRVLDALLTRGFIVSYASDGEQFGCIPSWKAHQFINNKEPASHIPQPPQNQISDASITRESPVEDAIETRGVKEGKGMGREMEGNGIGHVPDTADTRILAESVGIFEMKQQADMNRLLPAYMKQSGKNVEDSIRHMIGRWEEYQAAIPMLSFNYGSSYKFFMSGNWDKPELWPRIGSKPTDREVRSKSWGSDDTETA